MQQSFYLDLSRRAVGLTMRPVSLVPSVLCDSALDLLSRASEGGFDGQQIPDESTGRRMNWPKIARILGALEISRASK